ncbi:MAG: JAB domain-containing protein [bacterium]
MKQILTLKENKGFTNSAEVFKSIKKIDIDFKQENFLILCLNTKNKLIHSEVIFKGGLNACLICPKTLFRIALKYNSDKIIISHNHPSNDLNPSYEDIDVFKRLKKVGETIDIKVLDSIIFNKTEFYSFEDNLEGGLKNDNPRDNARD